jgi:acetyl esterase/lipase
MRYLREHSSELNIDPQKIIVCGGSAGGHLAAALSTIKGYNSSSDNLNTSCTPNAMILLYPAFDLVDGWVSGGKICSKHKIDPRAFSPALHVSISTPPTLILSGSEDPIAKSQCNLAFIKYMKSLKRVSSFIEYKGKSHKLFTRHKSDPHFKATLYFMERFLKEQGYLQNILATKPKIKITSHQ